MPRRLFADEPVKFSKLPAYRAEHFPYAGPYPWLDRPDASERIDEKLQRGEIDLEQAEQCRHWASQGYVILHKLIDESTLDDVWNAYERAIQTGKIQLPSEPAAEDDPYPGRFLNPHKKTGAFCQILKHPDLLRWIRVLMEREPKPLQTIMAHKGSQQGVHSDSIHMTTYPLGYLSAAWIAFEDIDPDSGPLVYYPGSHKLPYVFSKDVGLSVSEFKELGYASYHDKYEPYIQESIQTNALEPHHFHAKKGDVLIWHANLLHGGSPRNNILLSRRSLVCHFFVKGSFVYHDLAAAQSRTQYLGTCLLRDDSGALLGFGSKKARKPS
jgi:Phytanoyl-CoA dioxygenase (PhyH)